MKNTYPFIKLPYTNIQSYKDLLAKLVKVKHNFNIGLIHYDNLVDEHTLVVYFSSSADLAYAEELIF